MSKQNKTTQEFNDYVNELVYNSSASPAAFAVGLATIDGGKIVDVRFTHINTNFENRGSAALLYNHADYSLETDSSLILGNRRNLKKAILPWFASFRDDGKVHANIDALDYVTQALKVDIGYGRKRVPVLAWIPDLSGPAQNTVHAWLLLTMLSRRMITPNSFDTTEFFKHLPTVAFTNLGPFLATDPLRIQEVIDAEAMEGRTLLVNATDKFPRMTDYVPANQSVRIADASRVRLGAYLSPGTTVMHEGFVNFNAGTLGASMVEGRISAGVVVGDGSDIGGGASIMGTLSGGGTQKIVIGERSLLGANSGVGISIGDDCVVEAGLYVTAGTKVGVLLDNDNVRKAVKAVELSGVPNLLFRRNSVTGVVEALAREGQTVQLNPDLHGGVVPA